MAAGWISPDAKLARLVDEAIGDALRLGHRMSALAPDETGPSSGDFEVRCVACGGKLTVSPRRFDRAPVRGECVTFACVAREVPVGPAVAGMRRW